MDFVAAEPVEHRCGAVGVGVGEPIAADHRDAVAGEHGVGHQALPCVDAVLGGFDADPAPGREVRVAVGAGQPDVVRFEFAAVAVQCPLQDVGRGVGRSHMQEPGSGLQRRRGSNVRHVSPMDGFGGRRDQARPRLERMRRASRRSGPSSVRRFDDPGPAPPGLGQFLPVVDHLQEVLALVLPLVGAVALPGDLEFGGGQADAEPFDLRGGFGRLRLGAVGGAGHLEPVVAAGEPDAPDRVNRVEDRLARESQAPGPRERGGPLERHLELVFASGDDDLDQADASGTRPVRPVAGPLRGAP